MISYRVGRINFFFLNANIKLKAVYNKNARQQQRKVTWALTELLNTLRTLWLGAYALSQTVSEYR